MNNSIQTFIIKNRILCELNNNLNNSDQVKLLPVRI